MTPKQMRVVGKIFFTAGVVLGVVGWLFLLYAAWVISIGPDGDPSGAIVLSIFTVIGLIVTGVYFLDEAERQRRK